MNYSLFLFYSGRYSLSRYFKVADYLIDIRIAKQLLAMRFMISFSKYLLYGTIEHLD